MPKNARTAGNKRFDTLFTKELSRIKKKWEEKMRKYDAEREEHLRQCRDAACTTCEVLEGLYPELVARIRTEKKLRNKLRTA